MLFHVKHLGIVVSCSSASHWGRVRHLGGRLCVHAAIRSARLVTSFTHAGTPQAHVPDRDLWTLRPAHPRARRTSHASGVVLHARLSTECSMRSAYPRISYPTWVSIDVVSKCRPSNVPVVGAQYVSRETSTELVLQRATTKRCMTWQISFFDPVPNARLTEAVWEPGFSVSS